LIEFRPFRNQDAPLVVDVWRSQAAQRGLAQPMSVAMFDEIVLAKPFFDREGLILAIQDGAALGFVHAGFGPAPDLAGRSTETGVVSQVLLGPGQSAELAHELLVRGESFLRTRGSKTIWAGGVAGRDPFYCGLAGGSETRGLLQSDPARVAMFAAEGFQPAARSLVLHRDLARFRQPVDRAQMQLRRRMCVHAIADPPAQNWWDATTLGSYERTQFQLCARDAGEPEASITFWMMVPLSISWGVHAAGLIDLHVAENARRQGLATFLVCDALRQLFAQGISLVEVQIDAENLPATRLFAKLGFEQVDEATEYCKTP
jgi:ribosomal protein S18 acetylase RimI-like enzyme